MSCSSLKQHKQTQVDCLALIPEAPSRDADGHDDVGDHLGEENKEEDEEIEGAVTPSREREELLRTHILAGCVSALFFS